MDDFWQQLIETVQKAGFVPTESLVDASSAIVNKRQPAKDPITLFEAVRLTYGFDWKEIEYADVSFWNWRQIRNELQQIWAALDHAASRISGSPAKAVAWSYPTTRTLEQIVELVQTAASSTPSPRTTTPVRRPEPRLMVNPGKMDAAIVSTYAVLQKNGDYVYSDICSWHLEDMLSDEEYLDALDQRVLAAFADHRHDDTRDLIPRQLVRAKMALHNSSDQSRTFLDFLRTLDQTNNLSGLSNQALLHRLLQIAPESSKQALEIMGETARA